MLKSKKQKGGFKKEKRVSVPPTPENQGEQTPAWEMIEAGRYMPRRIRGSYLGRELG